MLRLYLRNQALLKGPMPRETFRDASSLEEHWIERDEEEIEWKEWPLLASDGDMAVLIELVSKDKVSFGPDSKDEPLTERREDRLQDRHRPSEGVANFSGVQQQKSRFARFAFHREVTC